MKISVGTRSVLWGAHCWFIHPFFVALAWWKLFGAPRDWRLWVAFFVHDLGYIGKPNMDGDEGERHVEWGANLMHRWFDQGTVPGYWKIVEGESGEMLHATWSIRTKDGLWFSCAHYPNTGWGQCAIESQVREWTKEGRTPGWNGAWDVPTSEKDTTWRDFCLYHSRFYAKRDGAKPSQLCIADKLAVALEPWWLYLPRVILSGEVHEYMARAGAQTIRKEVAWLGNGYAADAPEQIGRDYEDEEMVGKVVDASALFLIIEGHKKSKYNGEPIVSKYLGMGVRTRTKRQWHSDMTEYLLKWVDEHRDGREDTWTPKPSPEVKVPK